MGRRSRRDARCGRSRLGFEPCRAHIGAGVGRSAGRSRVDQLRRRNSHTRRCVVDGGASCSRRSDSPSMAGRRRAPLPCSSGAPRIWPFSVAAPSAMFVGAAPRRIGCGVAGSGGGGFGAAAASATAARSGRPELDQPAFDTRRETAFTEKGGVALVADMHSSVVWAGWGDGEQVVARRSGQGLQPCFGGEVAGQLWDVIPVFVARLAGVAGCLRARCGWQVSGRWRRCAGSGPRGRRRRSSARVEAEWARRDVACERRPRCCWSGCGGTAPTAQRHARVTSAGAPCSG